MSKQTIEVPQFDHPRTTQHANTINEMVASMQPYVVAASIAPNFNVSKPSASPTLHKAFDVDGAFDAASGLGTERELPVPTGYALKLDGSMPIDSKERLSHVFGAWNQGLGTSMYKVKGVLPATLKSASDADVARLNQSIKAKLPMMISPTHRVMIARTNNAFDDDEYALFVTANDVPAARKLYLYTAARAATAKPLTVETLQTSKEFAMLDERSQCARNTLAEGYASAAGVTINADAPDLTTRHYTIVQSNTLAHGNHESPVPQYVAREPHFFVAYNNASPTHEAHGGLIVSHGITDGYSVLESENNEAWHQPKFLSLMPATSVEVTEGHTQIEALHRNDKTTRSKAAFASRVVWQSDLGDEFGHGSADEAFNSMQDPFSQRWLARLGPPHGAPLKQRHFNMIAGQLPSMTTLHATPEELAMLARIPKTPAQVAVALDNPIVGRIHAMWDTVIEPGGYKVEIDDVFKNKYKADDNSGFRMLQRSTMCLKSSHAHAVEPAEFYIDAPNVSAGGVLPLWPSAKSNDAALRDGEPLDQLPPYPGTTDRLGVAARRQGVEESRTVLNLDKELLRLITVPPTELGKGD